jgi:hypothetical protein
LYERSDFDPVSNNRGHQLPPRANVSQSGFDSPFHSQTSSSNMQDVIVLEFFQVLTLCEIYAHLILFVKYMAKGFAFVFKKRDALRGEGEKRASSSDLT